MFLQRFYTIHSYSGEIANKPECKQTMLRTGHKQGTDVSDRNFDPWREEILLS